MLSGNGRHRRPRQAPALIVAAGVTGSAIAIPLLGATSASAAETTTWEKLAECESGGAWSANPGNGYYGGLQLSQETWEAYGGLDYATSADQASRSQQIAVAEKILDDKGTAAWPSCAPIAGLSKDGAAADVDPGGPITPKPSDSNNSSGSEGRKDPADSKGSDGAKGSTDAENSTDAKDSTDSKAPEEADKSSEKPSGGDTRDKNHDESGEKGDKVDDADKRGENDAEKADDKGESGKSGGEDTTSPAPEKSTDPADDATDPNGSSSGRHRGDRADEGDSAGDRPGRHASRGGDRSGKVADGTYTVRSGDNLSVIADDFGVDGGWHELYSENKKTVGADPDLILPGQSLDLGEK
ncbi:transglycosylase family protein [Streptomyces sp. NPDC050732]|uniref:transglycosylase family protein n=1 Tax=Streptomyces sp. NPDC050732 TaxID=3154632 RepID=UPI00343C7FE0